MKAELQKMNLSDLRFVCRELGVSCNGNKSNIINRLLKPLKRSYKMKSDTEQSIHHYETMNLYLQSINKFHQFRIDNRVITLLGERHNFEYGCKENGTKISVDKYILNYLKRHTNTKGNQSTKEKKVVIAQGVVMKCRMNPTLQ